MLQSVSVAQIVEKPAVSSFNLMMLKSLYRKVGIMAIQQHILRHTAIFMPTVIVLLVQSPMTATLLKEKMLY